MEQSDEGGPNRIERWVHELYASYPFPQVPYAVRHAHLPFQLCKFRFLGLEGALPGARVLDVGCGTGRNILIAKHYDVAEYLQGWLCDRVVAGA